MYLYCVVVDERKFGVGFVSFKPIDNNVFAGCKIPQDQLLKLLEGIGNGGIGMDCSVIPLQGREGMYMVSTTDVSMLYIMCYVVSDA